MPAHPLSRLFTVSTPTEYVNVLNFITRDSDVSVCLAEMYWLLFEGKGSFSTTLYSQESTSLSKRTGLPRRRLEKCLKALTHRIDAEDNSPGTLEEECLAGIRAQIKFSRMLSRTSHQVLFETDLSGLRDALIKASVLVPKEYVRKDIELSSTGRLYLRDGKWIGDFEKLLEESAARLYKVHPEAPLKHIQGMLKFLLAEMRVKSLCGVWRPSPDTNLYTVVSQYVDSRYFSEDFAMYNNFDMDMVWYLLCIFLGNVCYRPEFDDKKFQKRLDTECLKLKRKCDKDGLSIELYCTAAKQQLQSRGLRVCPEGALHPATMRAVFTQ